MNKSKLAIGLMTALLSAGTLAGCDNTVKFSSDGKIITYKDGSSDEKTLKADELLRKYYNDSTKYQSIFDTINSIVVRNYFTVEDSYTTKTGVVIPLGKGQMEQIKTDAARKVESDKKTAKDNASNNGTSYDTEFNAILSSKGAKDEAELKEKYIEEIQKETFDSNFYKYHINEVKNGDTSVKYKLDDASEEKQLWTGYFNDMLPYHVSHILVKLEDGSGTNYSNGTISQANAEKLYKVVNALKEHKDSFKTIAFQYSEDDGSAANFGDLGIMDYSTGYVNEFKLGIYAYENFMSPDKAKAKVSRIGIPEDIAANYGEVIQNSFGSTTPEIALSTFEELNEYAQIDKDKDHKSVIDDSANFYPRNIIYNKYLNRHSVAFVTDTAASDKNLDGTDATSGFHEYSTMPGKFILSVKTATGWTPVLVTRAGSDYQGIHFIVVNRSPFVDEGAAVSRNDYYTTFYPQQEDYPVDANGQPLDTYVNFSSSSTTDTKARAEGFVSTLKSYNADRLNKYIFKKYFEFEGLKINDAELEKALNTWIFRGFEKSEQERIDAWEKTWNDYIDTLRNQNSERHKLVSEACKIGYAHANESGFDSTLKSEMTAILEKEYEADKEFYQKAGYADKDAFVNHYLSVTNVSDLFKKEGGLCNDGKPHF